MSRKIEKADAEWRSLLSPGDYHITRERGTERAFTGRYWDHFEAGRYLCVCCGAPLFESADKFDAGCGWPSFDKPAVAENIEAARDLSHGMDRVEVICRDCGAHLGHVFEDGPTETGLRYCINSGSLDFEPDR